LGTPAAPGFQSNFGSSTVLRFWQDAKQYDSSIDNTKNAFLILSHKINLSAQFTNLGNTRFGIKFIVPSKSHPLLLKALYFWFCFSKIYDNILVCISAKVKL